MEYSVQAAAPSSSRYVAFLPRLFMSLLALAFFAAGVGLFVQHVSILRTWQPVQATVVRSEVIEFRNSKQRSMYRGEVELAYHVGGQRYQTPETFNHASSSESAIRGQMETTYASRTRHRIFYDPGNPYSVRWDVGINFTFFLLPIVFTGVGLILVGICYFLWRLPYPPKLACSHCGTRGAAADRFCPRCGDALTPVDRPVRHDPVPTPDEANDPDDDDFEIPPPEPRRENPRALLLVGAFFALPGVGCLIGAAYLGWTTFVATELWPTTEATVTAAKIEAYRSGDGTPSYQLAIEFNHGAGPQSAHAAGRSLYSSSSYPWIVKRLKRFAVGSKHTVRVNARDPADVRFDVESPLLNWMPTAGLGLFGGIFAAIGLGLVTWGLKRRCANCRRHLRRRASFCAGCGKAVGG